MVHFSGVLAHFCALFSSLLGLSVGSEPAGGGASFHYAPIEGNFRQHHFPDVDACLIAG
jgi:hypothetical protein